MKAYAKINWTLQVLGVRPDGYHELKSIVLPIALHDDIEVSRFDCGGFASDGADGDCVGGRGIRIEGCPGIEPTKNLIYIAARKLAERVGRDLNELPPPKISVIKRIPAGGGLGGGSADAAATIKLLNDFWQLNLEEPALLQVAAEVGSDVPALLLGGPVMMEGRGERVRRLTSEEMFGLPSAEQIEVYTPPIFSSTPAVYREFRENDRNQGRNDLQPPALRLYPGIADALKKLEAEGLQEVAMSGSGSTVYGVRR